MIFVNSMSDLFHEDVPDLYIAEIFAVMAEAHWHTFQVLTKRPERLILLRDPEFIAVVAGAMYNGAVARRPAFAGVVRRDDVLRDLIDNWPLPNVWLGTSIENLRTNIERLPSLRSALAAVRFLSLEPLLEDVGPLPLKAGNGAAGHAIDWVIVGGESGPHARPMNADWVRRIRDQCVRDGVPFFFKQWGGVHKRETGRELDGRTWDQMPATAGVEA
jgi:protein gp37